MNLFQQCELEPPNLTFETFISGQEFVFKCLGTDVLDNAFDGYNACVFAYGQTGECSVHGFIGKHNIPGHSFVRTQIFPKN